MRFRSWVFASLLLPVVATSPALAQEEILTVKLAKVDLHANSITVEVKGELFKRTLKVAADASIEVNGAKARLKEVSPGMRLTIIGNLRKETVSKIAAFGNVDRRRAMNVDENAGADIPAQGECPKELSSLDQVVRAFLAGEKVRGAAIVVVKDGKCVMARGYGHADESGKTPVDPTTLFPIDCVSRTFTAAAVVKISEEGKIDLEAPFFDALGTKAYPTEDDIPDNSRWIDATILDFLKDSNQYIRDPFIKEYQVDTEFREDFTKHIANMADGRVSDLDELTKYDVLDLEYELLGRLVAKNGGNSYESFVKQSILAPVSVDQARIEILAHEEEKDTDADGKKIDPKNKRKKVSRKDFKLRKLKDVAYVQFEAGREYLTDSMTLDSDGAWVASAIDLARFTMAFDNPEECPFLQPASVETIFAPKPEDANKRSGTYFASGWTVYASEDASEKGYQSVRRMVHSGPVVVASEGGLHIVIALTTGFAASRSGAEHPLLIELTDAARRIKKWPDVDLFPKTGSEAPAEAPEMVAEGAAPSEQMGRGGLPSLPVLPKNPNQANVVRTLDMCLTAQREFLRKGGRELLSAIRSSTTPDFAVAARRASKGVAAAKELESQFGQDFYVKLVSLQNPNGTMPPAEAAAGQAAMRYAEAVSRFAITLSSAVNSPPPPDQAAQTLTKIQQSEESMFTLLSDCLDKMDEAYPPAFTPTTNKVEFDEAITGLRLRLDAINQKLDTVVANRSARILSIVAKGAGAPAEDQAIYPILIQEIQAAGNDAGVSFGKLQENVTKQIGVETEAATPFLPAWKAFGALIDAHAGHAKFIAGYGSQESNGQDEEKALTAIDEAQKAFDEAVQAAVNPAPPGEASADATPPAEEAAAQK